VAGLVVAPPRVPAFSLLGPIASASHEAPRGAPACGGSWGWTSSPRRRPVTRRGGAGSGRRDRHLGACSTRRGPAGAVSLTPRRTAPTRTCWGCARSRRRGPTA